MPRRSDIAFTIATRIPLGAFRFFFSSFRTLGGAPRVSLGTIGQSPQEVKTPRRSVTALNLDSLIYVSIFLNDSHNQPT